MPAIDSPATPIDAVGYDALAATLRGVRSPLGYIIETLDDDTMFVRAHCFSAGDADAWLMAHDATYTGGAWPARWEFLCSEATYNDEGDES